MHGAQHSKMAMKKIGLIDAQAIARSFEIAALTASPENNDHRAVFRALMPRLYVMRKNGLSYSHIAKVLRQSRLPLSLTAVRTYYCEFLAEMEDECVQYAETAESLAKAAHG
jgi:hypothetical protein